MRQRHRHGDQTQVRFATHRADRHGVVTIAGVALRAAAQSLIIDALTISTAKCC
jgi:hypothetical protein